MVKTGLIGVSLKILICFVVFNNMCYLEYYTVCLLFIFIAKQLCACWELTENGKRITITNGLSDIS